MKNAAFLIAMTLFTSPAFAIHIYGNYECSNKNIELKYDGPGSNYAVGGYSHFYAKGGNEKDRLLSYEIREDEDSSLGESIGEETLNILFSVADVKKTSDEKSDLKVGDSCEAGEVDYQHIEWTSNKTIEIKDAAAVAAKLGLKKGDQVQVSCNESMDIPVRCPDTGKYGKDDLN